MHNCRQLTINTIKGRNSGMELKDVTKSIMEIIMTKIITGQLESGERLNENQWASDYNISRGPLREAFRLLEHEGLVTSVPRKGTFVKNL